MTDIYIPSSAKPVEDSPRTYLFAIQGPPAVGKTAAALTFPNPILLRYDNTDVKGLLELPHLQQVKPLQIPLYSREFVKDILKRPSKPPANLINRMEALSWWVRTEGVKLTSNQTLILDSWTTFMDACYEIIFHDSEKSYSRKGEEDFFAPWERLINVSLEAVTLLTGLNCNVVVIFHESQIRDNKTGQLLDKIQPLMQGKFVTKLKIYFPYFVRQHFRQPLDSEGQTIKDSKPDYLWQTKSNNDFDAKFIGKPDRPILIPAKYESLLKL